MTEREIIFTVALIAAGIIFVAFLAWLNGSFDTKTKWYKVDAIKRSYYDVPGIKPCNKCGQEKCNIVMNIDINAVGIYKKEVRFKEYIRPIFHIECPNCGARSREEYNLRETVLAWNMDSRFQLEENK